MKFDPYWHEIQKEAERQALECLTDQEREEYEAWLPIDKRISREIENNDRRHRRKRHCPNEDYLLEQLLIEDADERIESSSAIRRSKKGMIPYSDFLDKILQSEAEKAGRVYYRYTLLEKAVETLTDKQRWIMELTVIYGIPVRVVAKIEGSSERNIRKLRERALNNVRDGYAKVLATKAKLTTSERKFLAWYHARNLC